MKTILELGVAVSFAAALLACSAPESSSPSQDSAPELSDAEKAELDAALGRASGKADGFGLTLFESSYVNLVLAGTSDAGDFALVAGSHAMNFPYWRTEPWDNGLLMLGNEGYHFTQREQGIALAIEIDVNADSGAANVRYDGPMTRVSDGETVTVSLDVPVAFKGFDAKQLGKQYNFLDLDGIAGMRWRPFELSAASASLSIGDATEPLREIHGEAEHGIITNLRADEFAFSYDYVCVARPGEAGFAFVDFVSHPLSGDGVLGRVLEWYLTRFAKATLTLGGGQQTAGNPAGIVRPAQSDASVTLFENQVALGPANLRRQMIVTHDASGAPAYGLREIFEKVE